VLEKIIHGTRYINVAIRQSQKWRNLGQFFRVKELLLDTRPSFGIHARKMTIRDRFLDQLNILIRFQVFLKCHLFEFIFVLRILEYKIELPPRKFLHSYHYTRTLPTYKCALYLTILPTLFRLDNSSTIYRSIIEKYGNDINQYDCRWSLYWHWLTKCSRDLVHVNFFQSDSTWSPKHSQYVVLSVAKARFRHETGDMKTECLAVFVIFSNQLIVNITNHTVRHAEIHYRIYLCNYIRITHRNIRISKF